MQEPKAEHVFTKAGSSRLNRMLLPRHMKEENSQNLENGRLNGYGSANGILASSLKLLNVAVHEAVLTGISSDAYYSKGGDTGQVHREYRKGVRQNMSAYQLDDDEFMKVCFVAWKSITKGRRFANDRQQQLDRFAAILRTKTELDIMLKPENLKRHGAIQLYSILSSFRVSLLRVNFEFWRDISGLMRRKLAKYFDRWNVWTSVSGLRKMTAIRFCEIIHSTGLIRWNRRRFKRLAFRKWLEVGSYLLEMKVVRLLFRSWKTKTEASGRESRLRIKVALKEWHHLAKEAAVKTRKAVQSRQTRLMRLLWGHWVAHRQDKLAKKDSLARINNSNLSKISSISGGGGDVDKNAASSADSGAGGRTDEGSVIAAASSSGYSDAPHDISGISLSTMNTSHAQDRDGGGGADSRDVSVSVLQQSVSEEDAAAGSLPLLKEEPMLSPPRTRGSGGSGGGGRRGDVTTPGGAQGSKGRASASASARGTWSGNGKGKGTPSRVARKPAPVAQSKEALWELRMQSLKSLDSSFQEEQQGRLRASGL